MQEFFNAVYEWSIYGLKGIVGLLSITGGIAIIGAGITLVLGTIANIIFWPIYLTKRSKSMKHKDA